MEGHASKRRRVERRDNQQEGSFGLSRSIERASSMGDQTGKLHISKLVLPIQADHSLGILRSSSQEIQHFKESAESVTDEPTKIQARQLVSTQVNSVVQLATDATSTVLAIAIDNGTDVVSVLDVPVASKSVWIPGYGELTITNDASSPTATAATGTNPNTVESGPGAVTPPAAVAASQARTQALSTQEAIAKELDVVPQALSRNGPETIPSTPPQAPSSAAPQVQSSTTPQSPSTAAPPQQATASQSPMAISVPESRSQQVLSAPATPIPATPQTSAGSSASYFSSSLASSPSSSPPHTANPPTPSNILNPNSSQLPSGHNSTASAATSSGPSAATILSLSSKFSGTANPFFAQSTASLASISSIESLAALASATHNPSGFATSTRNSQDLSSGISSAQITSTSTTLTSSISSQLSSQSGSASSISGGPSSSGIGAGGVGGSGNTAVAPSPTPTSGSGSGGSSTPPTPVLAGGIVGGVAGAAIIIFALLLLFRWRRGKMGQRRNISPPIPQTLGPGGVPQSGNMTQRSSTTPIAAAGFFGRWRPASSQTATTADTAPSERGFQKISGRKLPSVLASGGDGYGDAAAVGSSAAAAAGPSTSAAGPKGKVIAPGQGPFAGLAPALRPDTQPHTLSGSSFYRDSHGFYGGVVPEDTQAETDNSSSPSNSPPYPVPLNIASRSAQGLGSPSNRPPEVANMRPGPARTPVINQPGIVPLRTPSRANQPPPRPARATPPPRNENPFRDGLGRSHPSQDGSRDSRFREDTTPP